MDRKFSEKLEEVLCRIEQQSRKRRVIFVLDQYGYKDVRMSDLRLIFQRLPNAEVILTVAIDWLISYWSEESIFAKILRDMELEIDPNLAASMKYQNPIDWRPLIQLALSEEYKKKSGADYYTPFFVHSADANRAYWLLHFSGHPIARDVMMQLHWSLKNHFQHFGQPGFSMLGYDPRRDTELWLPRQTSFDFDSLASIETESALLEQLPKKISAYKDGVSFEHFFNDVVNETPATKKMLAEQISNLSLEKEVKIKTADGASRRNGVKIADSDIIIVPRQPVLRLG